MKRLITISREYGSGGRLIGAKVADKLEIPIYDRELIDLAVERSGLSREIIESAELQAKSGFAYSLANSFDFGIGISPEPSSIDEELFTTQFEIIEQIGKTGEGVIIGRCADYILKNIPNVTNIFICGEPEDRIRRCVENYGETHEDAKKRIADYDKARANYYNYHTCQRWGDYHNYNLMINSSFMDEDAIADLIVEFVKNRKMKVVEGENHE